MRFISVVTFTFLSCFVLFAYALEKNGSAAKIADANIVSWFTVLNQNEITASKEALKKSQNPEVIGFANLMVKDHEANLKEIKQLGKFMGVKETETPDVSMLQKDGKKTMEELSKLKGSAFDQAYINDMVSGHADALAKIDSSMLPVAQQEELKDYIKTTRHAVEGHLEKAKAVQTAIQTQGT